MNYRPNPFLKGANYRVSAYRQCCLCFVTPSAFVNVTVLKTASCCLLFHEPQLPITICWDVGI